MVRIEAAGWSLAPGSMATLTRVLDVLEHKGVQFIENGVQLAKKPRR
jgi:hypothetical protein